MINYPVSFSGESLAVSGMTDQWSTSSSGREISCSIPEEFEGKGGAHSPEDLFLLALTNCFVATFKVFATYSKLQFEKLAVEARLEVDKDAGQSPTMKRLHLIIKITKPSDEKKANLLTKKTLETGFILQSVKTEITHELQLLN